MAFTRSGISLNYVRHFSICFICLRNHYEALGVSPKASQADIKAAYYKLSMIYHPDKNKENKEATENFRSITSAYEVIGNRKLRKMYDQGLLGAMSGGNTDGMKTYSVYNENMRVQRNKPTYRGGTNVYDFDAWSQFHYGEALARRTQAKARYDEKISRTSNTTGKNENAIATLVVFLFTMGLFSFALRNNLDTPVLKTNNAPNK